MHDEAAGWRALATLYNALATATVVATVVRRGEAAARELVFNLFRRQHLEKFLPGLAKLGLAGEPHAVACALYHYHSNALGGVNTEYFRESDRKAWVRYPPPRWMWRGTAIAAIPHAVSAAMLHGWHGHNGVSLGNPRLGFVCTGMTVDGMPGLEGYYLEHERALTEGERVRFAYGAETMPRVEPGSMPVLEASAWPAARRARTHRAYSMAYVRTLLEVLGALPDAQGAQSCFAHAARLTGLQCHEETALGLGLPTNLSAGTVVSAGQFAQWLAAMLAAQGESVVVTSSTQGADVHMHGWRLMQGVPELDAGAAFAAWNALWLGACAAHDRFLVLDASASGAGEGFLARWRVSAR